MLATLSIINTYTYKQRKNSGGSGPLGCCRATHPLLCAKKTGQPDPTPHLLLLLLGETRLPGIQNPKFFKDLADLILQKAFQLSPTDLKSHSFTNSTPVARIFRCEGGCQKRCTPFAAPQDHQMGLPVACGETSSTSGSQHFKICQVPSAEIC